ncbi:hypothetical protein GCM10023338_15170 [Wohlfahrtiimonas larvae]|uniref:DUF6602 domain-containing protein n=2 Tax=Wohlfahrtiimonas larvae TaxID=1157986 RepID=A0ABP9MTX5_9GAMM
MGIIAEKFNLKICELKANFNTNKNVVHQGIKGGLNEAELILLIKDVIPSKYKIAKGIIENARGQQSNETDIIIFDDEILPPYIKNDVAFVPVEAVKYNFEVKSKLNASELNTTIDKFKNFRDIGGRSPTVLFAFSTDIKGDELVRYSKYDDGFYINPVISVLCISNKGYYYKDFIEYYLKDFLSVDKVIEKLHESDKSKLQIFDKDKVIINGVRYSDITFKIHRWIGLDVGGNHIELSLLSGISNTLSKNGLGSYLLDNDAVSPKILAESYEDMWGNISCRRFDKNGLNNKTINFTFDSNEQRSQVVFSISP